MAGQHFQITRGESYTLALGLCYRDPENPQPGQGPEQRVELFRWWHTADPKVEEVLVSVPGDADLWRRASDAAMTFYFANERGNIKLDVNAAFDSFMREIEAHVTAMLAVG